MGEQRAPKGEGWGNVISQFDYRISLWLCHLTCMYYNLALMEEHFFLFCLCHILAKLL